MPIHLYMYLMHQSLEVSRLPGLIMKLLLNLKLLVIKVSLQAKLMLLLLFLKFGEINEIWNEQNLQK